MLFCYFLIYRQYLILLTILFYCNDYKEHLDLRRLHSVGLNHILRIIYNRCILILSPQLGAELHVVFLKDLSWDHYSLHCTLHRLSHHSYADDV